MQTLLVGLLVACIALYIQCAGAFFQRPEQLRAVASAKVAALMESQIPLLRSVGRHVFLLSFQWRRLSDASMRACAFRLYVYFVAYTVALLLIAWRTKLFGP